MVMRQRSIRARLTAMSALSSCGALLLACLGFLAHELVTFRRSMVDDLTADARVLAFGVTAPLLFDDPAAARISLDALRAKPRVRAATLAGKGGEPFATYGHAASRPVAPPPGAAGLRYRFESDGLVLSVPVLSEGAAIGTLTLESSLDEHYGRIRRYLVLTGSILVVALLAALGLSSVLQRRILQPISRLTDAARQVSEKADYSVRVGAPADDELGALARTFDHMLVEIERQHGVLRASEERYRLLFENGERAAEALRRSEARFARLLDAGIIGIVIADRAGHVREANGAFLGMVGYSVEDLRSGRVRWTDMSPPECRPLDEDALRQLAAEGVARPFEKEYLRKDGSRVPVLQGAGMLDDASFIGFVLDLSERRRLEQIRRDAYELEAQNRRIQEANRLKSQFLANMSHELRTPLNAILGFGELLQEGAVPPGSPQHEEFLGHIVRSGRHLLELINDVLDLAKVEAGKMEFRPEAIDLRFLVDEVTGVVRPIAEEKSIRLTAGVHPDVEEGIHLDPARLKQILYNFVSNALKFTPAGGAVTVRALPEGEGNLRLEVEDTGPGIAPQDIGRLFVEFQQLDAGTTRHHAGTGLGLALTRRLAEAQGGSAGVRSTLGRGSVFHVVLPRRAPAHPAPVQAERTVAAAPGAPSVLVVEDDPQDQALIAGALSGAGYAVEVVRTGSKALERCSARRFDAISLDLLLPDTSGQEVLRRVRAGGPNADVPVVVVTVVAEKGAVAGFAVHDFLSKPIDRGALLASLGRAGLRPQQPGSVMVVDDDESSLKLMSAALAQLGFRSVCLRDGEEALHATGTTPPAAVVLDLLMPGLDGFEFLDRLRSSPATRRTPVLIWTVKDLSDEERERLLRSAQAIVRKGHGGIPSLLEDLRRFLPAQRGEPAESERGR